MEEEVKKFGKENKWIAKRRGKGSDEPSVIFKGKFEIYENIVSSFVGFCSLLLHRPLIFLCFVTYMKINLFTYFNELTFFITKWLLVGYQKTTDAWRFISTHFVIYKIYVLLIFKGWYTHQYISPFLSNINLVWMFIWLYGL